MSKSQKNGRKNKEETQEAQDRKVKNGKKNRSTDTLEDRLESHIDDVHGCVEATFK